MKPSFDLVIAKPLGRLRIGKIVLPYLFSILLQSKTVLALSTLLIEIFKNLPAWAEWNHQAQKIRKNAGSIIQ
ncbi:MAG: hypothetical protein HN867_17010 [Deltaproteobacteria bacterium]|nr:hypothetical protein [Deltaproteobacteria bacterium]MBT7205162.1 hypothetical protein [Deltaproteobacteria bacterium]